MTDRVCEFWWGIYRTGDAWAKKTGKKIKTAIHAKTTTALYRNTPWSN